MSEPPAFFTLPAAVLAFLWAGERERLRSWLVPGFLFGLTALIRPEYLLVAVAFALLAAIRVAAQRGWRPGIGAAALFAAALLVPIVPWSVRNEIVLGRLVPISTGDGKALYVGTYLPADGEYQKVKALLVRRYLHRDLGPILAGARKGQPDPPVQPGRQAATRNCRATPPWARSPSRTSPTTSTRTRSATWR